MQIPAHIPARNFQPAGQRNHDVREILANTLAIFQGQIDRRIHFRRLWNIRKLFIEPGVQFAQRCQRILTPVKANVLPQFGQFLCLQRKFAGRLHFPMFAALVAIIHVLPGVHCKALRQLVLGLDFHHGCGNDGQFGMHSWHIEVMHSVPQIVAETVDMHARRNMQFVLQAALIQFRARAHPYFHYAF